MINIGNNTIQDARIKVIFAWIDYVATLQEQGVDVLEGINDLLSDLGNNEY